MKTNIKLLTVDYNNLSLEERARAIELARQAGEDEAKADLGAGGGFDELADAQTYRMRIVDFAITTGEINEADVDPDLSENDPRVQAFCKAWNETKRREAESLA